MVDFGPSFEFEPRTPENTSPIAAFNITKGEDAPLLMVQYSHNGTDWFDTVSEVTDGVVYIRFSSDSGVTWGSAVEIKGDTGVAGADGADAHEPIFQYAQSPGAYGTSVITDGGFDDETKWTLSGQAGIFGGVLYLGSSGYQSSGYCGQTVSILAGQRIKISLDLDYGAINGVQCNVILTFTDDTSQTVIFTPSKGTLTTEITLAKQVKKAEIYIVQIDYDGIDITVDNFSIQEAVNWHIPWADGDDYMRVSLDNGSTWGSSIRITGQSGDNAPAVMYQFRSSNIDPWETTYAAGDTQCRISVDAGTTWTAAIQIKGADGAAGSNGTSYYTYIAYADSNTGSGFSLSDTTKAYVAIKVTSTAIPSPVVGDFVGLWHMWTGVGSYTFIHYAQDSGGTGMRTTPADGYDYISVYTKNTSTTPTLSELTGTWKRFVGYPKDYALLPVLKIQEDATLDPGASPTLGDRYIIKDETNLNAHFGTIDKEMDGTPMSLEWNDIVEYHSSGEFRISFNSSDSTTDKTVRVDLNPDSEAYHTYVYSISEVQWIDVGFGLDHDTIVGDEVGVNYKHLTELERRSITSRGTSLQFADNYHKHDYSKTMTVTDVDLVSKEKELVHGYGVTVGVVLYNENKQIVGADGSSGVKIREKDTNTIVFRWEGGGSLPGTWTVKIIK
jgi:hypothetical protein